MSQHLPPSIIEADRSALRGIEELIDYQPLSQAYSTAQLQAREATMLQARGAKERARRAYYQACATEAEATEDFHMSMLVAKNTVVVQYGDDSYAVRAIGRTRRSDRKRPARRRAAS